jgi:hypothetical protein
VFQGEGGVARFNSWRLIGTGGLLAVVAALSACAPKAAPPKPAPPPVVIVPPRPYPPLGAPANIVPPPVDGYGMRRTINTGLTQAQATWNLRSAYNVAALNCTRPEHAAILENYRAYLKTHGKQLTATNKAIDKEFKDKIGKNFVKAREAFMTQVYNYFALPPTLPLFCDASLAMSEELKLTKPADLDSASAGQLARLDQVFKDFYTGYDQYRVDLAAWQARYYPGGTTVSVAPTISLLPVAPAR